ncbi:hypothetical protein WR25_10070 [Diploscapter pachys]|uniref:G-protein coupled receptors family 1 profile domain-containing protein n=1 Tax=Diploscapter pachys TaxID=2018661 RepID=A0A2A2JA99_9BILA|nr:hypothetical protein WR25_10070 [Diploscapter pachys]
MGSGSEVVDLDSLQQLIGYHRINIFLGAICASLSLILAFFLLTSRHFRKNSQLIITLAFADLLNCLGIFLMGIDRCSLYSEVIVTGDVDDETSWTCASQIWLFVRTLGDLWPPMTQLLMGLEQLLCVQTGVRSKRRSHCFVINSVLFVVISTTIGYAIAFERRFDGLVMFYCGRKATFGKVFSGFVYAHNVIGYVSGVVLNSIAAWLMMQKMKEATKSRQNSTIEGRSVDLEPDMARPSLQAVTNKRKHVALMQQIRSCLIVSSISTLLVSLPNCLSLCSLLVVSVKDSISKPAVYATCINSGINIFVYLLQNDQFRRHVIKFVTREEKEKRSSSMEDDTENDTITQAKLLNKYKAIDHPSESLYLNRPMIEVSHYTSSIIKENGDTALLQA